MCECYYCASNKNSFYASENGFNLVKCDSCGLLFVENRPYDSIISQAHTQGLHQGDNLLDVTGEFSPNKVSIYLKVLEDIFGNYLYNPKEWLDIGCGYGEFILAVKQYFPNVLIKGTEPNINKIKSARKKRLDVSFIDLLSHDKQYNVVSMLNVYSHIPNPFNFIELIKKRLKPGGYIIIQTGDSADLRPEDHWRPFYLPDHLSFASEKIIVGILEKLGFDIITIKKYQFSKLSFKKFLAEMVKLCIPKYKSRLKYYLLKKYSQRDMYVMARLR